MIGQQMLTGKGAHILGCDACGLPHRGSLNDHGMVCSRCGLPLHFRKPDSINRTWALLIASYILIIPANLLPVMKSSTLTGSEDDTIMGGVIYLWVSGSQVLSIILFIASIFWWWIFMRYIRFNACILKWFWW